jgi:hypothetical protein
MKRLFPLLIIAAALGGVAWLFLQGGDSGEDGVGAESTAGLESAALPAAGALSDPAAIPSGPEPGIARSAAVVSGAGAKNDAPAYAQPAPEGEGFLVRVIEDVGEAPIPRADVLFVDGANVDENVMRAQMTELHDLDALIEAMAVRYRTDAEGKVRLPLARQEYWIVARRDQWFGMTQGMTPATEGVVIRCRKTRSVSARVVDASGMPQGDVPVQLLMRQQGWTYPALSILSRSDGIATINRLEMITDNERGTADARFSLGLGGLLGEVADREFDPAAPPVEPLELVMPAHGTVEVRLVGRDGTPFVEPALVTLEEPKTEGATEEVGDRESQEEFAAPAHEGLARFRPVGLGKHCLVTAQRMDGTTFGELVTEGPLQEGEIVRVVLREQGGASIVSGRVLGMDGKPLANSRLVRQLEVKRSGGGRNSSSQIRTDANGSFRFEMEEPGIESGGRRTLILMDYRQGGSGPRVEADLSWNLPPGETNLGDLTLTLAPILAAGVVVDEAGKPLARVTVQARVKQTYGPAEDHFYWDWMQVAPAVSGAQGEFVIHAATDAGDILVVGMDGKHWCAGVEARAGATGLQVVMGRGASVHGQLLADPEVVLEDLTINLAMPDLPQPLREQSQLELDAEGRFSRDGLRPGNYVLQLASRSNHEESLIEIENLLLVAGEECHDPRLNPLDTRGLLRSITIAVHEPDGKGPAYFQVFVLNADLAANQYSGHEGSVSIPYAGEPLDLMVQAPGFLRVSLEDIGADCEVTLIRAPRVRLEVMNPQAVPAGFRLSLGVLSEEAASRGLWSDAHDELGANGVVEIDADEIGHLSVQGILLITKDNRTHAALVETSLGEIEVRDVASVQTFRITLDEASLNAAADQLEKQVGG